MKLPYKLTIHVEPAYTYKVALPCQAYMSNDNNNWPNLHDHVCATSLIAYNACNAKFYVLVRVTHAFLQ